MNRRDFISGAFAGSLVATGVVWFPRSRGADSEAEEWPYWTANWDVTKFELSSEYDDIQYHLGLRNLTEEKRTWPGGVWLAGQDKQDWIERMPLPEIDAGAAREVTRSVDAESGRYEGGILGVDTFDTEVTVDGN